MSAKWMRVETDFVDHPKVRRLCTTLGNHQGGWFVMRLWSFMSRFCPTGHLRDIDGTSVETECEWSGAPGKLISALVECEFLDEKKGGGWAVHDWDDHQGRVAAKAQKERERKAEYRRKLRESVPQAVPQLSHGTSAGHPAQRDVTGRDVTYIKGDAEVLPDASPSSTGSAAFALTPQEAPTPNQGMLLKTKPKRQPPNPQAEFQRFVGSMSPDEKQVFEQYEKSTGLILGADWALLKFIRGKLKTNSVDEICRAIQGHAGDAWNREHGNLSLRSMLADATKIAINAQRAVTQ